MIRRLALPLLFGSMIWLSACLSGDSDKGKDTVQDNTTEQDSFKKEQIRKILYTIPSPISMASLIRKAGANFDKDLLNETAELSKYTTSRQQALNLGIYGADLSYSSMFDQDQEAILYLSSVQKLCSELGIDGAIESDIYERLNRHMGERDSVLNIVSETYFSLDIYLKNANREDMLALIIAGGWVEAVWLATNHLNAGTPELRERVAEQKYAVNDLVKLLESYEQNDVLASVTQDIKSIQQSFDQVQINKGETETSADESGTMVIGGSSTVTMSDETLAAITAKVKEVREKYIH